MMQWFFCKSSVSVSIQMKLSLAQMKFLNTTIMKKAIPFCIQQFFKRAFVSVRLFCMFILILRLMIDENAIDVDGDSLGSSLKTFFTLVKMFMLFVIIIRLYYSLLFLILFFPKWIIRSSDFSLVISSTFSKIFSLEPPEKFTIFTLWLLLRRVSDIPFTMEFPVTIAFSFLFENSVYSVWLSFFCLELGLGFTFSVSIFSTVSVTVSSDVSISELNHAHFFPSEEKIW